MDLLILAPVFHSPSHGAATYYRLLCGALSESGYAVGVVSDREPGRYDGLYLPLLPRRCGLPWSDFRAPAAYAVQNLCYLRLPAILDRLEPRTFLVHSSFFNFPGLFPSVVGWLRRVADRRGIRLVADVRETWIPRRRLRHLERFDAVIACSDSVIRHLRDGGLSAERLVHIPVPQEPIEVDESAADRLLEVSGLAAGRYILYSGLIKEEKGAGLLLDAFLDHVRPSLPEIELALAGLVKTSRPEILERLERDGVRYLGPRSRAEVLALASRAALCATVSAVESLSRSSLEALALGRPTLLPPGIPEFERHCPEFIATSREPAELGAMMVDLLRAPRVADYPIEEHSLERLVPRYLEVLGLGGGPRTATPI